MRINYDRRGNGSPLLLLHGIGSNRRSFRHQLSDLSDAFDVIAWDAPGYGLSEDPRNTLTMEDFADCAAGLFDELQLESAHVLGVSMGGVIAQLLYHRHASRVKSLILCDTNPGRSTRTAERLEALERMGARGMAEQRAPALVGPHAPADLIDELADIMADVRPAGYCAAAIGLGSTDLTPRLASIRVPALVIHGEQDGVVPPETGRKLAESIPGARFVLISDAGHVSNQEQPDAFNRAVRQFLLTLGDEVRQ